MESKLNWLKGSLGCLRILVLILIITSIPGLLLACLFCNIDPYKTYSWYSGIWHGLFCIPNWTRSLFDNDILYKANSHTFAYNFWWWVAFIISLLPIYVHYLVNREKQIEEKTMQESQKQRG